MSSAPSNFHEISSPEQFQEILSADLNRVSLLNFWAPWAEPCTQMNEVVLELARKYPQLLVLQVEAESQADISESFEIEAVPSFIILRVSFFDPWRLFISPTNLLCTLITMQGHTLLGRISGADAASLTSTIATHLRPASSAPLSNTTQSPAAASYSPEKVESKEELHARLTGLMNQSKVVLFMKGNPEVPRCGFSRKVVGILKEQGVQYSSFDILSDDSVRSGE